MHFGAFMFHTDYSMPIVPLAQACEARGFESLWAPEHSHIPLSRKSPFPGGGDVPKMYYDAMDPFVILTAAAAATKTLKVGTGVCLVIQRDTIQTAKAAASLDQVSGGRFLFGIGGGWNQDEMEDHGTVFATRFKRMREQVEAMREIWTKSEARIPRRYHRFPADDGVAETGAEPVADHRRRRLSARGAARGALRQRLDSDRRARGLRQFRRVLPAVQADAGRSRADPRRCADHDVRRGGRSATS